MTNQAIPGHIVDELSQKVAEKGKQASELRAEANQCIAESRATVDALKALRILWDEQRAAITRLREEKNRIYSELTELQKRLSALPRAGNSREAGEELRTLVAKRERLEWRLQTESTNAGIEKAIAKEIRELEREIPSVSLVVETDEKNRALRSRQFELRKRLNEVKTELANTLTQFEALQLKGKQLSEKMTGLRKKIGETFRELDAARKETDTARERLHHAQASVREGELARQRSERARDEEHARRQRTEQQSTLLKRAKEIEEKLRGGKTISLEEMQVLAAVQDSPASGQCEPRGTRV